MGEGCQGIFIKDPWTKPKRGRIKDGGEDGWGQGEWWGENGDNST